MGNVDTTLQLARKRIANMSWYPPRVFAQRLQGMKLSIIGCSMKNRDLKIECLEVVTLGIQKQSNGFSTTLTLSSVSQILFDSHGPPQKKSSTVHVQDLVLTVLS